MTSERFDEYLKRELPRQVDAPEERPEFVARLWARIEGEDAHAGSPIEPGSTQSKRRPPWARRRLQISVVAAATIAAAAAVLLIGLPGSNKAGRPLGPQNATAAQRMIAAMTYALSTATTMQGDFVERTTVNAPGHPPAWAEWRGTFAATANGDYRYEVAFSKRSDNVGLVTRDVDTLPYQWVRSSDRPDAIWTVLQPARYLSLYEADSFTVRWASWFPNGELVDHGWGTRWPISPAVWSQDDMLRIWAGNIDQAALVRAAVDGDADLPVREITYEGRLAWEATIGLRPSAEDKRHGGAFFRTIVTVDQASGFIVKTVLDVVPSVKPDNENPDTDGHRGYPYRDSPYTVELRVENLKLDAPLPASTFTNLPAGVPNTAPEGVPESRYGTSLRDPVDRHTLAEATTVAGFKPLVPDLLPEGYAFSVASTTSHMGLEAPAGEGFMMSKEIDQLYRRGFDWFEVDVFPLDGIDRKWLLGDLRSSLQIRSHDVQSTVLESGAEAGARAYTWQATFPRTGADPINLNFRRFSDRYMLPLYVDSGLVVLGDDYFVFIRGSISTREMLQVANSLRVYGK